MVDRLREMFLGTYYHALEANRRITLPKAFRAQTTEWVVTRGFDGGLLLLPEAGFLTQIALLENGSLTRKDNRDLTRLLTNEAARVTPDSLGRIQLPEYLTKFAKLDAAVVLVGSLNYIEVWDRDTYHQYIDKLEPQAEAIAERMNEHERN